MFGPTFWKVPGGLDPAVPGARQPRPLELGATSSTGRRTWRRPTSGGRYQSETYCCLNGTNSASYPSAWYAFDAGNARFYVLDAAWANSNVGTTDVYENDYDYHWAPGTPQYQWLENDLATNPRTLKFAFFHYPIYSDNATRASDPYLQGPDSLEGLLSRYGVDLAFNGHAHTYQRNPSRAGRARELRDRRRRRDARSRSARTAAARSTHTASAGRTRSSEGSACGAATPSADQGPGLPLPAGVGERFHRHGHADGRARADLRSGHLRRAGARATCR